jgi:hypothetical protein
MTKHLCRSKAFLFPQMNFLFVRIFLMNNKKTVRSMIITVLLFAVALWMKD